MRRITTDDDGREVEVLDVSAALAANVMFEAAIRGRAQRLAGLGIPGVARVRSVERHASSLRVVTEHVEGLRLPDLLHEAVKGNIPLSQPAALELARRLVRIVAAMHEVPGLSHGAITPAHVIVTRSGDVVLTDAVFGPAIEALQRNREQLWREFRLALPASASLPRFDQRADIAQLGATVLAIALGRALRESEYPRAINEVVIAATLAARPGETGTSTSALRMWLQEALHLHPRATFSSAIDAEQDFARFLAPAVARRGGAAAYQASVRRIFGDTPASAEAAHVAAAWSAASSAQSIAPPDRHPSIHPEAAFVPPVDADIRPEGAGARDDESGTPLSSLFRSVFPLFRAS